MFTNRIEQRMDTKLHTIMVEIDGQWVDVRFVEGHRGLTNAAWVMHSRAMERRRGV